MNCRPQTDLLKPQLDFVAVWVSNIRERKAWRKLATPKQLAAGIWEQWCDDTDGKAIKTCSILTKTPDPVVSRIHGRMPVILPIANYAAWLSNSTSFSELSKLWEVPTALAVWRVSKTVNSPVEDSPKCIEPEVAEEV